MDGQCGETVDIELSNVDGSETPDCAVNFHASPRSTRSTLVHDVSSSLLFSVAAAATFIANAWFIYIAFPAQLHHSLG